MTPQLEQKLSTLVQYFDDLYNKRRKSDDVGMFHLLADPELQNWLHEQSKLPPATAFLRT